MSLVRVVASCVPLAVAAAIACSGARPPPPPVPGAVLSSSADAATAPVARADSSLVPRKVFLGDPDRAAVKVSPDGTRIGWLGPVEGVPNVWVGPADDVKKGEAVTHQGGAGIRSWWWSFESDRVLFVQDGADESRHLYVVDLAKHATRDLAPIVGVDAQLLKLSSRRPHEALLGLNDSATRQSTTCTSWTWRPEHASS